jgi:glycosyltransferase involved in cell wall biosynthesis
VRLLYVCLDRGVPIGGTKGAAVHAEELLRAFEQEGHTAAVAARVFASAPERLAFELALPNGMRYVPGRILRRDLRELRGGRALAAGVRNAIASFRPDAVYERYALFRTETQVEARRAGVPLVLEVNAPLAAEERRFRGLRLARAAARAEHTAWTAADLVIVPSAPLAELVRATGQQHVHVVPNAVDPERFRPSTQSREVRRIVGFAGSLKRWHDLDTLLDASAQADAAVLLVGDGPERQRLESRAQDLGLELRVTGAIPHADVSGYLATMDVCVAGLPSDPSLQYFSPLKALEYLAAGRPTVVAAAGDLRRLADEGVALAYAPGDAAELAARLRQLLDDEQLRDRLVESGRAYAASRTWRAAARRIVQEIERPRATAASA